MCIRCNASSRRRGHLNEMKLSKSMSLGRFQFFTGVVLFQRVCVSIVLVENLNYIYIYIAKGVYIWDFGVSRAIASRFF